MLRECRAQIGAELSKAIVGQEQAVEQLLLSLLAGGHCLITGAPGLAKTLLVKSIAQVFHLKFQRIQFTPDLMPADITGTEILEDDGSGHREMVFVKGPIFANVLLADEINRTPPKTQAALLEAMQEHHVNAAGQTYVLNEPFFVLATQNPIEQEGTYPLPEAQLDRFLMHVKIGFPDAAVERKILQQARGEALHGETKPEQRLSQQAIFAARKEILGLYMADAVEEYLVQLVMASRTPARFDAELGEWLTYGASPRGSIALDRCARAHAWLAGRDFVSPEDIQTVLFDVLRHRLILSFEAEAAGVDQDRVIQRILDVVAVA
jgi:MoxR-like ATPase